MLIAIDPGVTGALSFFFDDGRVLVDDMPSRKRKTTGNGTNEVDPTALQALLRSRVPADEKAMVVMENLNTFAKSGGARSIASMQASKDVICAVMELNRIDVAYVSPRAWQSFFGIKKTEAEDTKAQSFRIARQLYPELHLTKTSGRPDAVLIGRYGLRHFA
ncbi:hypothetical protein A9R05_06805 [Burkholderia sp. KK1]|nr:hypothetical protein A9R05_06805 [Burkholderia sp. KK1]